MRSNKTGVLMMLPLLLLVVSHNNLSLVAHAFSTICTPSRETLALHSYSQLLIDDEEDAGINDDDDEELSDSEVLLACRSYLQRKNRLGGWTKSEERKELRREAMNDGTSIWNPLSPSTTGGLQHEEVEEEEISDPGEQILIQPELQDNLSQLEGIVDGRMFTGFPDGPTERSMVRSTVKKAQWKDEEFRKRWYKSRWGKHVKKSPQVKRIEQVEELIQSIPSELWENPAFASLSSDEIEHAIATYKSSTKKRAKTRKATIKKRKDANLRQTGNEEQSQDAAEERLDRDSLFTMSEEKMREKQRKRSERAAKAYQTRVDKKKEQTVEKKAPENLWRPEGASPREAMIRITSDLDLNQVPSLDDVKVMMSPAKLSRRKELLKRILNQCYNKRGKCVPSGKGDGALVSLTKASVAQLGSFAIDLIDST